MTPSCSAGGSALRADRATSYARAVVAGEIVTGHLVRLACERHLRDLEHGQERGLWFDAAEAERAIDFFSILRLHEGEHEGTPFVAQPSQCFIIGSIFGWKARDPERPNEEQWDWPRRFRTAYVETAKGNGKTPLAAGIGLFGIVADREHGAEVYTCGVTRDQAAYLYNDMANFVGASPSLAARIEVLAHNMSCAATGSYARPVSSEGRSLDQKRVHMALIEEIHEHRTDQVVRKMRAGTKGRRSAIIVEITNSGYDRHSICWEHHEYSIKVLHGTVENDAWFGLIFALDPCDRCHDEGHEQPKDGCPRCDDWRNEAVWEKPNPLLSVSISRKYLREQVAEALGMPGNENIVKRLNFCIWTEQDVRAISIEAWDRNAGEPQTEPGRRGYGALDLASTTDLSSFTLLEPRLEEMLVQEEGNEEPHPDDVWVLDITQRFWVPAEGMRQRVARDHVPYDVWVREGWIKTTPGDVTDYEAIREELRELSETHDIAEIGYDRWNASQLVTELQDDGFLLVPMGQGMASLAAPWRETKRLIIAGRYRTGGHPVLRWMASNVAEEQDAAGNAKPSKKASTERIDGMVTITMATGCWMVASSKVESNESVWNTERRSLRI